MADNDSGNGPLAGLKQLATKNPATERLVDAGQEYLNAKAQSLVGAAGAKMGEASKGGGSLGTSALKAGASGVASKVKDAVSGLTGGGGKSGEQSQEGQGGKGAVGGGGAKLVSIIEDIDIGVPVREAYNQWTQYQEFSQFSKGVTGVDPTDEVTSNWRVKVAKSNRSWTATVTEQIPDERIAWTSEGAKGATTGVVTFHPLGDNLTKVLLVLEYYPQGLFEKTGSIWRAQGRRARLDLKHFRRYIMLQGQASDGWRGEIRDSEVVRSSEDVEAAESARDDSDQDDYDSDQDSDEADKNDDDGYDRDEVDEDSDKDPEETDEAEEHSGEDSASEDDKDESDDEPRTRRRTGGGSASDIAGDRERRPRQSGRHSQAGSR